MISTFFYTFIHSNFNIFYVQTLFISKLMGIPNALFLRNGVPFCVVHYSLCHSTMYGFCLLVSLWYLQTSIDVRQTQCNQIIRNFSRTNRTQNKQQHKAIKYQTVWRYEIPYRHKKRKWNYNDGSEDKHHLSQTASLVELLACSPRVRLIVDSNTDRFKLKTMKKLVFVASSLSTQH